MCTIAREILNGENAVGRVIARPFVRIANEASNGPHFERTSNRRDFALRPDENNVLSHIKEAGHNVVAVGKISDIFAGVGITEELHTTGNADGMAKTREFMDTVDEGLIFTNLVDFDMKYGHRRDVTGYRNALLEFDNWLGGMLLSLNEEDILIINADHGCDPTYKGSDHTREYIPLLVYGKNIKQGVNLGVLASFADIGRTVEEYLVGKRPLCENNIGTSFLDLVL
jgi:phosphopentomutase